MTFGERLKQLRIKNGYPRRKHFAEMLNIPHTTLRNYETNAREPGYDFLVQMSNYFNVSTDYLLGTSTLAEKNNPFDLTESEHIHLTKYRDLTEHGKNIVDLILDVEWQHSHADPTAYKEEFAQEIQPDNTYIATELVRMINYFHRNVSAGTGEYLTDDTPKSRILIWDTDETREADFAIGVNGDSMEPLYYDCDIVLVKKQAALETGDIGIFIVNNESYLKKLGKNSLISLNTAYADIVIYEFDKVLCLGKVLGKTIPVNDM